MSHFVTLVLVPKTSPDIEAAIGSLLAPYDEEITVDPYETDGYCVGTIARTAGTDAANRQIEPMNDLRDRYWQLPEEERPAWDEWIAGWTAVADCTEQAHSLYQKPNPHCEDCHGSGQRLTTYNPDAKWDWLSIGGRWDGWLSPTNVLPAMDAATAKDKIPFAVLTPAGVWHEKGQMGWWGMTANEQEDAAWASEVHDLLLANPDTLAVACDLHI